MRKRSARRWRSVADGIDVQGDIHAGPEYRAHLARVFAPPSGAASGPARQRLTAQADRAR